MVERKSETNDPRRSAWSDIRPPSRPLTVPTRRLGDISQPSQPHTQVPQPKLQPSQKPAYAPKPVVSPTITPPKPPASQPSARPRFETKSGPKPTVKKKASEKLASATKVASSIKATALKRKKTNKKVSKKAYVIAAVVVVLLALSMWFIFKPAKKPVVADSQSSTTSAASDTKPTLTKGSPTYATLLPAGKTAASVGGWTRVSPPNKNAVFAYTDAIDGVSISVSEQPLPTDFKEDPDAQVKQLASNYNATQKIPSGGTTAWLGTSRTGPQTVIFYKQNILFLAKSTDNINSKSWSGYITSLE